MRHRIVILGAGTGGTLTANRLHKVYGDSAEVVVIDRDDRHVYQPGLLFVPFGLAEPGALVRPRHAQLHNGIEFRVAEVDRVETADNVVHLAGGETIGYDVLVVASGASLLPEETEGLTGPGWEEKIFTFYTLEGATALRDRLRSFDRGRLVVNMVDLPVKCPVAPLEFCFLADWHLRQRRVRDRVEITYVTSLDGAFTKATCNRELSGLLADKGIEVTTEFNTGQVDGSAGKLVSWDEREVPFDLLVTIPLHGGAQFVSRSPGLGDDLGFVSVDRATLQAEVRPNVFAIGDATNVPTSKAGSVAHFEGETLVENIRRYLDGRQLESSFDGHTNCFIETGFHKALLIDFNYEIEPLPGKFPEPHIGPLRLLGESRLNHLGKLAFGWVYWHMLLPGRGLPGISSQIAAGREARQLARQPRSSTMTPSLLAGLLVERDREGFFTDPQQWTEEMAGEIARENGVDELTDRHWIVIRFMRKAYLEKGSAPSIRTLGKVSGVPIKELYQLFPKGPAKLAAKIAGIPKPRGCI